jgi:hypothetical protein
MNVDLLIKENKELSEEKQRYKEMWFLANDSLSKYKDFEEQIGCPLEKLIKFSTQVTVYTIYGVHTNEIVLIDFSLNRIHITKNRDLNNIYTLYISDYKKTWWLKKDKSE